MMELRYEVIKNWDTSGVQIFLDKNLTWKSNMEYAGFLTSPVCDIVNLSFAEQKLPRSWKDADVSPHKKTCDHHHQAYQTHLLNFGSVQVSRGVHR